MSEIDKILRNADYFGFRSDADAHCIYILIDEVNSLRAENAALKEKVERLNKHIEADPYHEMIRSLRTENAALKEKVERKKGEL